MSTVQFAIPLLELQRIEGEPTLQSFSLPLANESKTRSSPCTHGAELVTRRFLISLTQMNPRFQVCVPLWTRKSMNMDGDTCLFTPNPCLVITTNGI